MTVTMTMRQARLAGYEKCTVDMRAKISGKTYTQNCYFDYVSCDLIWNDVVANLEDDTITTDRGTEYYMLDFEDGHANLRPANTHARYMYITKTVFPVTKFRSNKEYAQYHYFNQNGAYKRHRAMIDTLMQYVEAGHINSGWLIAHDSEWEMKHIVKAAMSKRTRSVCYYVDRLEEKREDTFTSIAQVHLGEKDRAGQPISEES